MPKWTEPPLEWSSLPLSTDNVWLAVFATFVQVGVKGLVQHFHLSGREKIPDQQKPLKVEQVFFSLPHGRVLLLLIHGCSLPFDVCS